MLQQSWIRLRYSSFCSCGYKNIQLISLIFVKVLIKIKRNSMDILSKLLICVLLYFGRSSSCSWWLFLFRVYMYGSRALYFKFYMHGSLFFCKKNCRALFLECYMHSSLFFYKNTALWYILECYMHGSLFFSENTAVYYILECYMHGNSIQFVVFKPLSYFFEETIGFDK